MMRRTKYILVPIVLILFLVVGSASQETKENAEFKLAVNLYKDGLTDLALDQFKNFVSSYPSSNQSIEARYYIGMALSKLKRYEDARVAFQNFALTYTDHNKAAEAWFKVGEAYVALENYREAALAFERVRVFHPRSPLAPEALLLSAKYFRSVSDVVNARKNLRVILQDYSSSELVPAARLSLSELFFDEGNIDLATREVKTVADGTSKYRTDGMLLLGRIYHLTGQYEEADKLFSKILVDYKGTPAAALANLELGLSSFYAGDYNKAVEYYKKTLAEKNIDSTVKEKASLEIGIAYYKSNDFKNSSERFEKFIKIFPKSEKLNQALFLSGKSFEGLKNNKAAINSFNQVINSISDEYKPQAYARASIASEMLDNVTLSVEYCKRYLEKYPDGEGTQDALIRIGDLFKYRLKDYDRAIIYYEEALQAKPHSYKLSSIKLKIGESYSQAGNYAAASRTFEEILKNYPSDSEALAAKENLNRILIYENKNYKSGLEKIAKLLGDFLIGKNRGELAFNLAQVYFEDLKDYQSAVEQYSSAIEAKITGPNLPIAYYNRATAAERATVNSANQTDVAQNYHSEFIKLFPNDKNSQEAAFNLLSLKLRSTKPEEAEKLLNAFISTSSKSIFITDVYKLLIEQYLQTHKLSDALTISNLIIKNPAMPESEEYAMMQAAKIYYQSGKMDSAIAFLKNQPEKYPNGIYTVSGLKLLGDILLKNGKPEEAVKVFKKIEEEYYYTEIAQETIGQYVKSLIESNKYDEAIYFVKNRIESDAKNPFAEPINYKYYLAKAYDLKGESQKAISLYREYLLSEPSAETKVEVYIALGNIMKNQGVADAAAAYYKLAGKLGSVLANREIADLLFQTERYLEASQQYSALLVSAINEDDKKYFLSKMIVSKLRIDDLKSAQPLILEFSKNYKKSVESLAEMEYEKALIYFRKQDYSTAKKIFTDIADDYDGTRYAPLSEYYLGRIMELNKNNTDAIKKYESVLKKYSNSDAIPRVFLALGNINFNGEKYAEAIKYYQQIVDNPDKEGEILRYAMINLIEAYEATKLNDAALKMARNFIERYPKDASITEQRIKIGILYTRLGYYDQAVMHFQSLLDEAGSDYEAEIRYNLGETYYYKGDYQQGILEFLKVPYLVIQNKKVDWTATSFYMAGQSYERMEKYDQALSMYQQIIDRPGIDATFKAGAQKEIDRVKSIIKRGSN
ncbi:MAG: tetratricopeptide repeat protein [Bacteroidota bacterium]|nr:tetratricopeptide repeat protein [Bacteroidota bacterium]